MAWGMTLFKQTIPVLIGGLENTLFLLGRTQQHATHKKISEGELLAGRLAPDMYNLKEQVGYIYFIALEAAGQLSGKEIPEFSYDESTIDELKVSLERAIAFLKTITDKELKGAEERNYSSHLLANEKLPAEEYVFRAIIPNFYFHVAIVYGILRHLGVPLVKQDYIGKLQTV
jgi:uncharacterized protein